LLAAVLLVIHASILFESSRKNFLTYDEVAHIPAGLAHWHTGSFSFYRVNPPLTRMLAVLPLLRTGVDCPNHHVASIPGHRPEWYIAEKFWESNSTRLLELMPLARLAGISWSVLGGWLIFRWARELYGATSGLLGLALWCFEPNIMAHAQLATPDVPCAVMALAASYAFWQYLRERVWC
jgi:hypothetical protein